jgi:hypothetical protein
MEFKKLVEIVGDEPVFETALFLAGNVDPGDVRRQLSRWTKSGRLLEEGSNVVVLEPDVAKAFGDSSAVNEALRSLLALTHSTQRLTNPLQRTAHGTPSLILIAN